MKTVAVMQPYFLPYAGYFRLFAAADVFVVFDCVQFPRRGWVHRNRFNVTPGTRDWLTLPLQKCSRDTRIADLRFAPDAAALLARGARRFPLLERAWSNETPLLAAVREPGSGGVADYLCAQLALIAAMLGLSRPMIRSSSLGIPEDLHGQARVIAIARSLEATHYVNPPGGRALYDPAAFNAHDIALRFLAPFSASTDSILTLLLAGPVGDVAQMIRRETVFAA